MDDSIPDLREITLRLTRRAMACDFDIIVRGSDRQALRDAADSAFEEIERLDEQLSCFRPTSELSYLHSEAAQRAVMVEPGLFSLLQLAQLVHRDTGGAFDITAGPLIDLWRDAEITRREPRECAIEEALSTTGMHRVVLSEEAHTVRLDSGTRINLGAIGKGFAAERALAVLREAGISDALVSAGGSTVRAAGSQPGEHGWIVGIRHPRQVGKRVAALRLVDTAIATSGGVEQRDAESDATFEHILDPATGAQAVPSVASVTVAAPDAALADALSTAFYLRGEQLAREYCRAHPEVRAYFVVWAESRERYELTCIGGGDSDCRADLRKVEVEIDDQQ